MRIPQPQTGTNGANMEESKKKFIETVKQANNILVTVRSNPSIDHLSACIALSLMLNEMGKHATAVFSGNVPPVMDFLEPQKTLKIDTDSLQDFIISLDKVKADKLRYKVEDDVVKIFITPYKTSITSKDLEFSQGDFNVDVIVTLGVHSQEDLDKAITSHGRILHDATVVSLNVTESEDAKHELGSINWVDTTVSSLSEMLANSIEGLEESDDDSKQKPLLDNQVATALLTGIVAETDRFGNSKTTPATMQTSATLLMAGANQELVATKLSGSSHTSSISLEGSDEGDIVGDEADDSTADYLANAAKAEAAEEVEDRPDPIIDDSVAIEHSSKTTLESIPEDETASDVDDDSGDKVGDSDAAVDGQADLDDRIGTEAASDDETELANDDAKTDVEKVDAGISDTNGLDLPDSSLPEVSGVRSDSASAEAAPALSPLDLAGGVSAIDPEGMVTGDGVVAPKVYDLNQISVPASIPTTQPGIVDSPQSQVATWPAPQPEVEAVAPAETQTPDDQEVLNVLSQSKPINTERTTIQPLRDQGGFVAQPPLLDKKSSADGTKHESVDSSLDPVKFAVTPPTMGGTLTAGHDLSSETLAPDPMAGSTATARGRSIMTRDPHDGPGSDITQGLEAADSGEPRGVGELDPNAEPVEHNGLPQFGLIHADKPADGTEVKAVPPTKKHVINPLAANDVAAPAPTPSLDSLAQLEAQMESAQATASPQPAMAHAPAGPIQANNVDQALQAMLSASGASGSGLPTFDMPQPNAYAQQQPSSQATTRPGGTITPSAIPPSPPPMAPVGSMTGR